LTAAKSNRREGRVLCARTTDGGKTWTRVGYVGSEPKGYAIMPASIRLSASELLCLRRCRDPAGESRRSWIDAFLSTDNGRSWNYLNDAVPDTGEGNPPSLIRLRDGRLCLTYGYRAPPFSMCARLSTDEGRSWSEPTVLRDDGASRDIGYPRSVQRPDGMVVTVYYFHDQTDVDRKIVATIWDPGTR
jgi:Neuraminidase (sialidase)